MPKYSIVVPLHNEQENVTDLYDRLKAVMEANGETFEIVLVDDGSSDRSSELARGYAATNPGRIRYLEHPGHAHRGTGPSRNLGLASATGAYAAFLDADDVYLPDRLAWHMAAFERHPRARLVISREIYWRQWPSQERDHPTGTDEIVGPQARYDEPIEPPMLLRTALERRGAAMPGMCSVTFDRRLALDLGAIPEHFTSQYEDQALIAKLMLAAVDAGVVDAAGAPGHVLVAALALTDAKGGPRCASVRPPAITWTAAPAG